MGSSGGGTSGAVSHSPYLERAHNDWLDTTGVDVIGKSVTDAMASALGASPWLGQSAYNPDADIAAYETVLADYKAVLAGIVDPTDWAALLTQAQVSLGSMTPLVIADIVGVLGITNALIVADVANFAIDIDNEIVTRILPRLRRGMQDINAVVSSAFPIGEAVIDAFRNQEVAKYDSALRIAAADKNAQILLDVEKTNIMKDIEVGKTNSTTELGYKNLYKEATEQLLRLMVQRIGWEEGYAKIFVEATRIKLVAKKEETDKNSTIDVADAKWDLEVFQHGANLLAAIGGGTSVPYAPGTSPVASTLGGVLSVVGAGAALYNAAK